LGRVPETKKKPKAPVYLRKLKFKLSTKTLNRPVLANNLNRKESEETFKL
jgi:hypothetical protein